MLGQAYGSDKILKEFVLFIGRHITQIRNENSSLANIFWNLTLEMKLVLNEFNHLSKLASEGPIFQRMLQPIYRYDVPVLRRIKSYLESVGQKRTLES